MIEQPNIFELGIEDNHYDYEKYFKLGTTIKLFEAFAGVGCQAMAFKRLGIPYESVGISDEDFEKASKVCSNAQLYKQAGNGIVVDVFAGILRGLI